MTTDASSPTDPTAPLPQGDLRLLETDLAQRLLTMTIPARVAYVAKDGSPRITSTWFQWTDGELVMPTFVRAPHVHKPARRLADLAANPAVAVSIDTEPQPPEVLLMRGEVTITEKDGVDPDYAISARQYLGEDNAKEYLAMLDQPITRMARITLRPSWVGLINFDSRVPTIMAG